MWAVYSSSYLFWFIYGGEFDLSAVLSKLVGLGYEVAKTGFREGFIYVDPLPGAARGDASTRRVMSICSQICRGGRWASRQISTSCPCGELPTCLGP
jgi:hypothetical protein